MTFSKRTKKLVKSGLQLRLILVFVSLSIMASLFQVFLLNRSLLSASEKLTTDGDKLLSLLPSILATNMLLTSVLLVPVMLVVGLFVTHRVAGPVYRFEAFVRARLAGEPVGPCKLRQGDELQDLCDLLNDALPAPAEAAGDGVPADGVPADGARPDAA